MKIEIVFEAMKKLIKQENSAIRPEQIIEETGLDRQGVYIALSTLKRRNQIRPGVRRGTYVLGGTI